jgi:cytochrome P450 family 9
MFIIRDPQLVKKLCVKDFDFFSDHRVLLDESQDKLFGKALIALKGDKWKGI